MSASFLKSLDCCGDGVVLVLQTAKYLQPKKVWKVKRRVGTESVHYDLKNTAAFCSAGNYFHGLKVR